MNCIKRNIPNAITCLNVVSGTFAVLAALHGNAPGWGLTALQWAWILVGVAAVADFCDGLAARALRAYSPLGKELDSLCDLVSFGLAPAVITAQVILLNGGAPWLAWCTPLIAVCGALRLARFNVAPEDNSAFTGLPIPANAIFWVGFAAWYTDMGMMPTWLTLACLLIFSWLMVSPLRLFTLKFRTWGWRGNAHRWTLIAAAPLLVLCAGVAGLMWTIVFYVALSAALQAKIRK